MQILLGSQRIKCAQSTNSVMSAPALVLKMLGTVGTSLHLLLSNRSQCSPPLPSQEFRGNATTVGMKGLSSSEKSYVVKEKTKTPLNILSAL